MADINQTECQMSHEWYEGACAILTDEEKAVALAIRKLKPEADE